ncbi:MAG TPA: hypothetical protein VIZ70_02725 [Propionibacteriaceae bacterium]|jgi:hypothetical protein
MSPSSPDTPPIEVPEADWAEQAVAVDPLAEAEAEANGVPANISRGIREADDADLVEQETVVYGEDDDSR